MTIARIASGAVQHSSRIIGRLTLALGLACGSFAAVAATTGSAAGATTGPVCHIPGELFGNPIVTNVHAGETINMLCTGLPANTEFLFLDTSLLIAIDPGAQALLSGNLTGGGLTGLLSAIQALPEINAASLAVATSGSTGNLTESYTLPTLNAADPNAVCPPTTIEYNSGLIGCAVAMLNATTQKVVSAGTFLTVYAGMNLFPPNPTLGLTPVQPAIGQAVHVSDAFGATTYWWLATLATLEGELSGGTGNTPSPVKILCGGRKIKLTNAAVTPASYSNSTFTPPKLTGTFVPKGRGRQIVTVSLTKDLSGFDLSLTEQEVIHIG